MTLVISHLEDGTLFLLWKEKGPPLVRDACEYIQKPMKQNVFRVPSFKKSQKGLPCELHDLYQKRQTTSSTSFSAFLRTTTFANETTTATMEEMFFNTMRLHEHIPSEKWSCGEGATVDGNSA